MSNKLNDVMAFACKIAGDSEVLSGIQEHQHSTSITWALVCMRNEQKLSQRELAKKMGVSASKVCRMEASADADLNLGDIILYTKALNINVSMLFDNPMLPAADRIKHHVFAVHDLLEKLRAIAKDCDVGDEIPVKIKQFYGEVLFNFLRGFHNNFIQLPGYSSIALDGEDIATDSVHSTQLTTHPPPPA